MENLLIIGSTSYFLDLVNKAKEKELNVIICDKLNNSICKKRNEKSYNISLENYNDLFNVVRENKINGVITSYTDTLMKAMVAVAEEFNLSCVVNRNQLQSITNKKIVKNILTKNNVKIVKYRIVDVHNLESIKKLNFPIIMKPLDSCGSKGISIVENYSYDKLIDAFNIAKNFSNEEEVIVEEFYISEEVQVMVWVKEGNGKILYTGDRKLNKSTLTPNLLVYPSKYEEVYLEEIQKEIDKIIKAFDIKNGPLYLQLLIGKDGIKICEVMSRLPAGNDYILLNELQGVDIEDIYIDFCLGREVGVPNIYKSKKIGFIKPIYKEQYSWSELINSTINKLSFVKKMNYYPEMFNKQKTNDLSDIVARVYCVSEDEQMFKRDLEVLEKYINNKK